MAITNRKRCTFGKSCSATCISKKYFCIVELGPEIEKMLKQARDRVRSMFGSKDTRKDTGDAFASNQVSKATQLAKEYKSLPKGDPRKKELGEEIRKMAFKVGSQKGYDSLTMKMRKRGVDLSDYYD